MEKRDLLKEKINEIYHVKDVDTDFMKYFKLTQYWHVSLVAEYSEIIYKKEKAGKIDLIMAGVWTHDIADAFQYRTDTGGDDVANKLQKNVMLASGYSLSEVEFVKNEITDLHSCNDILPTKIEGKIVATADAMSHLKSDFYLRFCWDHMPVEHAGNLDEYKGWVLSKIERDFNKKIFFEWVKEDMKEHYLALKKVFSS